jgi:hypothetical protein
MQQQLFHSLRNAKQLTKRNKGKWETRKNLRNETKFYLLRNETKRHFAVFCVSRNKRNFAKQLFCFALFRVSRNKKKEAKWKPYFLCVDTGRNLQVKLFVLKENPGHRLFSVHSKNQVYFFRSWWVPNRQTSSFGKLFYLFRLIIFNHGNALWYR